MDYGIRSSLSALRAFGVKQDSIANNVANVNTKGYKEKETDLVEGQNGSVRPHIEKNNTPGPKVYEETGQGKELVEKSNVDITEELVEAQVNKRNYQANAKMVEEADEMTGTLLDITDEK